MNAITDELATLEGYAEAVGQDIKTLVSADFRAFLNASSTIYADLKAYAEATGKADVGQLLSDLKSDLEASVASYLASGGNVSAAIAAFATAELGKLGTELTADLKNAFYGAIAIVGADLKAIVGASSGSGSATPASSKK